MTTRNLKIVTEKDVAAISTKTDPVSPETLGKAAQIVADVRKRGDEALREYAIKFGDLKEGESMIIPKEDLKKAFEALDKEQQQMLKRVASRIRSFAQAQRGSVTDVTKQIDGGSAGHFVDPVESAGCYAPGGRYPLPSSVLMTCITARVAGVKNVWVASPKPQQITKAAAHVAGADSLLCVGGAQAIAALAHGTATIPACDAVVGPGNAYVTAAKQLIAGNVAIDTLAGPSECLVIADETAKPAIVAADLLAQAEHDTDARAILVAMSQQVADAVDAEITKQLGTLPTKEVAAAALKNSFCLIAESRGDAAKLANLIAPEHLELHVKLPHELERKVQHYGGLFIGTGAGEVLGDYGAGPNHVLPTRGAARSSGGLSVFTFLRIRTWMNITNLHSAQQQISDSVMLARLEGLEGHARAAEKRLALVEEESIAPPSILRMGLPKGRMEEQLIKILRDGGIKVEVPPRGYRPSISLPGVDVKMLKPRNIVEMITVGSRDLGFSGRDLVAEFNANVKFEMDLKLNPVRIVAAAPANLLVKDADAPYGWSLKDKGRPYRIATEYSSLTAKWIKENKLNATVVHTRGSTEVFPPEDADFIVDNTATGSTLKANKLEIFDVLMKSTTCMFSNPEASEDPQKRKVIDTIKSIIEAVLTARPRYMCEFHVEAHELSNALATLPCMRAPTVHRLEGDQTGYALKICSDMNPHKLIKAIKRAGGQDIVITKPLFVIP